MKTTWKKQILVVLLLIGFPLVMAYINGKAVYESLVWEGPPKNNSRDTAESTGHAKQAPGHTLRFGVYDPERQFDDFNRLDFEICYFSWINFDENNLVNTLKKINKKGRTPFLVCEPWAVAGRSPNYLDEIPKGGYDSSLHRISSVINHYGKEVYFSWGHEMDQDLTVRYSWSAKDPVSFINAYQYVKTYLEKGVMPDINWVWSPVAKPGCLQYWPGSDYVDYIGFPVYSFPEWDRSYYGFIRDFATTCSEKYGLVKQFNKPVFIVEFGVAGTEDFTTYWTQQAFKNLEQFPLLKAVFFFYAQDIPHAWGDNLPTPDWRMNRQLVEGLVDYYKK